MKGSQGEGKGWKTVQPRLLHTNSANVPLPGQAASSTAKTRNFSENGKREAGFWKVAVLFALTQPPSW